jgi:uncharacterized peroxidase-related enzyme
LRSRIRDGDRYRRRERERLILQKCYYSITDCARYKPERKKAQLNSSAARADTDHWTIRRNRTMAKSTSAGEERISWFPVPSEDQLPDNLRGLFNKAKEKIGFTPNVFRVYSFRPERLSAWFAHHKQLHEPTENLSAAEREMIAVAVSMVNQCLYCLVAHGAALREALGDPIKADRITLDYRRAGLDAKMEAVLDFAVKLTELPVDCSREDIEHLMSLGLTQEEVWDVIEIAAMYNFTNRMASATGMIPNREYHALAR